MAKKGFNYWYTCSIIDKEILSIQENLEANINGLIAEICPYIPEEALIKLAEDYVTSFYSDIESHIEAVRSANSDIRNAAERQIEEQQTDIENLQYDLDNKEREVSDLESEVARLEDEIESLKQDKEELRQMLNDYQEY